MNKKLAFSLALLTILMVVSAASMPTQAATYKLGVAAGDTADYTAHFSSNTNITKAHLSVHNATGTVAGLDMTLELANGSAVSSGHVSLYVDVASTNGSNLGFLYLIAGNLTTGDPVYPTATETLTQTTMIVAGVNRTVNYVSSSGSSVYWDKDTGIVVKAYFFIYIYSVNMTMTATNIWSAGGFLGLSTTTLVIVAVVVLIVIVAIVLLMRRRK
jgi:hypothetical protein